MPQVPLEKADDVIWRIPRYRSDMRVPVLVFASEELLGKMRQDRTLIQASNVATLPGILKHAVVLPDAHEGYGFPIGGVAATSYEDGVISPGGVGYDINCGVRLMVTNLDEKDVRPKIQPLINAIFRNVPSGLGSRRKDFRVTKSELDRISIEGARYVIEKFGLGWPEDLKHIEEEGCLDGADPSYVSAAAKQRGFPQIGTLGSGNHFLEVQKVD
ncbi:MAG TPA: RtcB family protein, partial [Nitrososphaeria archaeon]|nr:RtcB family protein [Nitrososphaeria archaeon]